MTVKARIKTEETFPIVANKLATSDSEHDWFVLEVI